MERGTAADAGMARQPQWLGRRVPCRAGAPQDLSGRRRASPTWTVRVVVTWATVQARLFAVERNRTKGRATCAATVLLTRGWFAAACYIKVALIRVSEGRVCFATEFVQHRVGPGQLGLLLIMYLEPLCIFGHKRTP